MESHQRINESFLLNFLMNPKFSSSRETINLAFDKDAYLRRINRKYITIAIITILTNLLVLLLIWTSKANRQKPFLWHVTSLSVWYLFYGTFIIPLSLDYRNSDWFWKHGEIICNIMRLASILHLSLCSLILICACIDRMLTKLRLLTHLNRKLSLFINLILVALPWLLVVTITLPVEMEYMDFYRNAKNRSYCSIRISFKDIPKVMVVVYIIPMFSLAACILIFMVFYVLKGDELSLHPPETEREEASSLRMSTVALWTGCVVFFACWLPVVTNVAAVYLNLRKSCLTFSGSFTVTIAIFESVGGIIPFVWLFLVEICTSIKSCVLVIRNRIHKSNVNRTSTGMALRPGNEQN